MKKTRLNSMGKIGLRNAQANKTLKWIYNDYGITTCEIRLPGCTFDNFLTFAHDHKRDWYKIRGNEEKLAEFKHTLLACQNCHNIIEEDKELIAKLFKEKRNENCTYRESILD